MIIETLKKKVEMMVRLQFLHPTVQIYDLMRMLTPTTWKSLLLKHSLSTESEITGDMITGQDIMVPFYSCRCVSPFFAHFCLSGVSKSVSDTFPVCIDVI